MGIADKTDQGCDKAISIFSFQEKTGRSAGDGADEWDDVFQEMVRVLRLKHRSIRTEKSYIVWIRRFRGICEEKPRLYSFIFLFLPSAATCSKMEQVDLSSNSPDL